MMLLRARTLAMGFSGARPVWSRRSSPCSRPASPRSSPSTARSAPAATSRPLAHCALALIGEGEVSRPGRRNPGGGGGDARGGDRARHPEGEGGPGPDQRHRRHPRDAGPGGRRPAGPAAGGGDRRGDLGRGAARHRSRLRRGPDRAAPAAGPGRERGQPAGAARRLGDRRLASRGRPQGPGRLLAALRAAGDRRRPRLPRLRRGRGGRRARGGDRQPDDPPRRKGGVMRQLPRRAARPRLRLPRDRRRRRRRDRRAAHRPPARRGPLPWPAALPGRGPRSQLGDDDLPVHPGRAGRGEPAPGGSGQRRLAPDQRDAGGPRLDGLGCGAQAARLGRQPGPRGRGRGRLRGARPRPAGPAAAGGGNRGGADAVRAAVRGPGPDRWLAPELAAVEALVAGGGLLAAVEAEIGELR